MMRILITGGTGLLGKALIEKCLVPVDIVATYVGNYEISNTDTVRYVNLDVLDESGYAKLFEDFKPEVLIHTASIGSPDYAEKNKDITWKINVSGTKNLVSLCEKFNTKLIFISSNGIYDGNNAPYAENDLANPVNYYGETKLEGEEVIKKFNITYAILRPNLMYGWNHSFERPNIVTLALSKLLKNEKVFAYDDVRTNALFSGSCAEAVWKVIKENKYDTFNIAGNEIVSIYTLLKKTAEIFELDASLIEPVKQGYFNELVSRPKDTSYRTDKMEKILKVKPLSLSDGLKIMRMSKK